MKIKRPTWTEVAVIVALVAVVCLAWGATYAKTLGRSPCHDNYEVIIGEEP